MSKKLIVTSIPFTSEGRTCVDEILMTLGNKTKQLFLQSLLDEFNSIKSINHQMMTLADVFRVSNALKLGVSIIEDKTF